MLAGSAKLKPWDAVPNPARGRSPLDPAFLDLTIEGELL